MRNKNVITVFTMPSCPNCPDAKKVAIDVAKELNLDYREVDIKQDFMEGLMYQVMETPSIALNNETLFFGQKPSKAQLLKEIKRVLQ